MKYYTFETFISFNKEEPNNLNSTTFLVKHFKNMNKAIDYFREKNPDIIKITRSNEYNHKLVFLLLHSINVKYPIDYYIIIGESEGVPPEQREFRYAGEYIDDELGCKEGPPDLRTTVYEAD